MKKKSNPLNFNNLLHGKAFRAWMVNAGMSHDHAWDILNTLRGRGAPAVSKSSAPITVYAPELWQDYVLFVSAGIIADEKQLQLRLRKIQCIKKKK